MKTHCAKCGIEIEKNSGSHKYCLACAKEASKTTGHRWRKANPEIVREMGREYYRRMRETSPERGRLKGRQWRAANPEKAREITRKWRAANIEKARDSDRRWRESNPEKAAARMACRRATVGSFTADELKARFEECGNKCAHCGTTDKRLTVDHITPLKKGGTNFIDNIQPLCKSCNSSKGARFVG